jgi:ubiquitin-protein ligase
LCDPNPASPANSEASRLYQDNRRGERPERVASVFVMDCWNRQTDLDGFVCS